MRKIFASLMVVLLAMLMLCSCFGQRYYNKVIKKLQENGFTIVGGMEEAIENLDIFYEKDHPGSSSVVSGTSSGFSSSGLAPDIDSSVVSDSNSSSDSINTNKGSLGGSSSGLIPDSELGNHISDSIINLHPIYTNATISNSIITVNPPFDTDADIDIEDAVLLKNEHGEFAIVMLFNNKAGAVFFHLLYSYILGRPSIVYQSFFGKQATLVFASKDVLKDVFGYTEY